MPYLNSATLMGNLTADIELRETPSGVSVASFSLAVNTKTAQGESRSEFFDCEVFGGWAANLAKTARKGALVLLEGRLAQEQWIDKKSNSRRSRVKLVANRAFHLAPQYASEPAEAVPEEAPAGF